MMFEIAGGIVLAYLIIVVGFPILGFIFMLIFEESGPPQPPQPWLSPRTKKVWSGILIAFASLLLLSLVSGTVNSIAGKTWIWDDQGLQWVPADDPRANQH